MVWRTEIVISLAQTYSVLFCKKKKSVGNHSFTAGKVKNDLSLFIKTFLKNPLKSSQTAITLLE